MKDTPLSAPIPPGLAICGTGHRPNKLGGYTLDVRTRLRVLAIEAIRSLALRGLISGMAQGWDWALAEAAIHLQLPWVAAIPCANQERLWPKAAQAEYHAMLAQATKVIPLSAAPYSPALMQKRNEWMVNKADLVLALWDGSAGGTTNCIHYAQSQNKQIVNVWDQWQESP